MQLSNPFAWILILAACLSAVLFLVIWRRRKAPGVLATLWILAGTFIWSLCYGLQLFSTSQAAMLFWTKLVYIGVVAVSASWLVFVLEYTGRTRFFPRRYLLFLLIEPVIILALAWTDDLHHLINQQVGVINVGGFYYLTAGARGPAFWVQIIYSYILVIIATIIMIRAMIRSPWLYRGQAAVILIAVAAPWAGNIFHILMPQIPVDPTPLAFTVTGLAISLGIVSFRLFNVVPVARDLVVESMTDAVLVMDDLGNIVDANPAARRLVAAGLGQLPGQARLMGQPAEKVLSPWMDRLQPFFGTEAAHSEVDLGDNHQVHWYDLRVSPARVRPNDRPIGRVLVFHDIQERKRAEEMMAEARDQALQASLVKSQLIANVSHDLRTPLNAILGFGEMLLDNSFDPLSPRQAEVIQQVVHSAMQVNMFVSDLLDQSLIEKGKLTLYPSYFHTVELIQSIETMFGRQVRDKGLLLQCEIEPGMPRTLFGDEKRLQQVLMNLVGNAVKFTERGFVSVHLYCLENEKLSNGGSWVMEVTDSGRGIPEDAHEYIFEPFRQVDGSPTRKHGGAGLGLAIARHLVTMMGGHIELQSQLGRGSTFKVILPLAHGQERTE